MVYFLMDDLEVVYYSNDYNKVTDKLVELYRDKLYLKPFNSINEMACEISEAEIRGMYYSERIDGETFFSRDIKILKDGVFKENSLLIEDSSYLFKHLTSIQCLSLLKWLSNNKDRVEFNYVGKLKDYCVVSKNKLLCDCNTLSEAKDECLKYDRYTTIVLKIENILDYIYTYEGVALADIIGEEVGCYSFTMKKEF